jgi:hypothetical protein
LLGISFFFVNQKPSQQQEIFSSTGDKQKIVENIKTSDSTASKVAKLDFHFRNFFIDLKKVNPQQVLTAKPESFDFDKEDLLELESYSEELGNVLIYTTSRTISLPFKFNFPHKSYFASGCKLQVS